MFHPRNLIFPMLLLFSGVGVSQAQDSIPLTTTTYRVQVEKVFWRNGYTYWSTVLETNDRYEAEVMEDLLWAAFDNHEICKILNCGVDWMIIDIRLTKEVQLNYQQASFKYPYLGSSSSYPYP